MEYSEILTPFLSSLFGGGGVVYVGYKLFKQKSEFTDEQQSNQIDALVLAQKDHFDILEKSIKDSNNHQKKNNDLQQKQLDNTDKEVMLLRERFQHYRENSEKFQTQMIEENKKTDEVLQDTTKAITGLDATMKGLKELLNMVLNQK